MAGNHQHRCFCCIDTVTLHIHVNQLILMEEDRIEVSNGVFFGGKKNPRTYMDNTQSQTQPTFDTGSRMLMCPTLVGGKHFQHCTGPRTSKGRDTRCDKSRRHVAAISHLVCTAATTSRLRLRPRQKMRQITATRRRDRLLQQIASCDM